MHMALCSLIQLHVGRRHQAFAGPTRRQYKVKATFPALSWSIPRVYALDKRPRPRNNVSAPPIGKFFLFVYSARGCPILHHILRFRSTNSHLQHSTQQHTRLTSIINCFFSQFNHQRQALLYKRPASHTRLRTQPSYGLASPEPCLRRRKTSSQSRAEGPEGGEIQTRKGRPSSLKQAPQLRQTPVSPA
jgi:hypothetical protein